MLGKGSSCFVFLLAFFFPFVYLLFVFLMKKPRKVLKTSQKLFVNVAKIYLTDIISQTIGIFVILANFMKLELEKPEQDKKDGVSTMEMCAKCSGINSSLNVSLCFSRRGPWTVFPWWPTFNHLRLLIKEISVAMWHQMSIRIFMSQVQSVTTSVLICMRTNSEKQVEMRQDRAKFSQRCHDGWNSWSFLVCLFRLVGLFLFLFVLFYCFCFYFLVCI